MAQPASGNNNISPLERQALQDLYDSTDGSHWDYNNVFSTGIPWDFSNPDANPCDEHWYGVTCSADYHVIKLNLRQCNLRGTLPSTIGLFSYLQDMVLDINKTQDDDGPPTWDDDGPQDVPDPTRAPTASPDRKKPSPAPVSIIDVAQPASTATDM